MFHNSFDVTLPKIQTFLTGQGAQDPHHRSTGPAELLPAVLYINLPNALQGPGLQGLGVNLPSSGTMPV